MTDGQAHYCVGTCPFCDHQGRLFLQMDLSRHTVYAHCEECEQGYRHPQDLTSHNGGFLTLLEDGESREPTAEEVARSEWAAHLVSAPEMDPPPPPD